MFPLKPHLNLPFYWFCRHFCRILFLFFISLSLQKSIAMASRPALIPEMLQPFVIDSIVLIRDTVCSSELPVYWHQQTLLNSGTYEHDTLIGSDSIRFRLFLLVVPTNPPKPGKPVATSLVLCNNQQAQFSTASSTGRAVWEFYPPGAGSISGPQETPSVTVQWSAGFSGKVKVLARSKNSCGLSAASDTLEVWVLPTGPGRLPRPVSADSVLCVGADSSSIAAPFPASQYLWAIAPINAGGISGSGDSIRVKWNPSFTGMAFIFYNSVTPCGFKKSDTLAIRIKPRAASSILNLDTIYCIRNAQVNLEGIPAGGQFTIGNSPVLTFSIAQAGLFEINYQPPGCFAQSTKMVRVKPKVAAVISAPDTLVCANGSALPLVGIPENGLFLVNGEAQTQFQPAQPGFYTISYHAFCTDTAKRRIRAAAPPDVQISWAGQGFCLDTLPAALQLQPSGGQLFHNGNAVTSFIPDYAGIHTLIYKVDESLCSRSDTAVAPVSPRPELYLMFDNPDLKRVCRRDTAVNVYGWPESGFFSSPAIQNSVLNPRLLAPGQQFISYLGYNGVCLDSASLPLMVLDVPEINFGLVPDTLCEGAAVISLDQTAPSGGSWAGAGIVGNLFSPERSGINRLIYSLPAVDSLRCSSSAALEIFVKAKPQTRIGADTSICEGESILLGNSSRNYQFVWNDGSRENIREISSPGRYFFTVRDGLCNWNSDTLTIGSLKPLPVFSLGPDRSDCFRDSLRLAGPAGMSAYNWVKDGIQFSGDSVLKLSEPASVQLSVISKNGCSYTDLLLLVKKDCPEVHIPEAFSPNGDGVNEVWKIFGSGILSLNVKVFNLWGEVVFEGLGKEAAWDGNFRGQPCPAGAYQYVLQYSGSSAERGSFSDRLAGQVFVVR